MAAKWLYCKDFKVRKKGRRSWILNLGRKLSIYGFWHVRWQNLIKKEAKGLTNAVTL